MIQSVDHSIHYQDSDGFVARKEEPFELQELSDYLQAFPTRGKLKTKELIFAVGGVGLLLSACSAALPTAENPSFTPTLGPEVNDDVSFGIIPNSGRNEAIQPGQPFAEVYCSDDLQLCVFHQFDQNGKALAPRAYTNSKINFDLDNNAVVVTGDPLIQDDNDVWIYPPHDGQEGYETVETMSVEEATAWMENMSEVGRGNMQTAIDEAKSKGVGVNILMKTVLNVEKNAEGQDRLVDMIGGLAVSSGEEGATIALLNDTLEPLTENELLKDQQIAGVDFVPQFDGTEKLVMEVYPSDWKNNGEQWVSPQFIDLQTQIAAAGERFTLLSDGTIQQTTSEGAVTVPGLFVGKNGVMTLQVTLQGVSLKVSLSPADVTWSEENIFIKGYKFDGKTKLWGVAQEIVTTSTGLELVLGPADETGAAVIEKFVPPEGATAEEQAEFADKFDESKLELVGDWVLLPDQRIVLLDHDEPSKQIAEYKAIDVEHKVGNDPYEVVWSWDVVKEQLLKLCEPFKLDGAVPVNIERLLDYDKQLSNDVIELLVELSGEKGKPINATSSAVFSPDRGSIVVYRYAAVGYNFTLGSNWARDLREGYIGAQVVGGESFVIYSEGVEWEYLK